MKIDDRKLYCYLQGASLTSLLDEVDVLDGLLKELRINAHGRRSHLVSVEDKLAAIDGQLKYLSTAQAMGFAGVDVAEILAVHIWRARKDSRKGKRLFHAENDEEDLKAPVMKWLASNRYETHTEIPMSVSKADIVGVRLKTGFTAGPRTCWVVETGLFWMWRPLS